MKTQLQAQAADPLAAFDGTHDTVVDFLRRRVPMVMAINTVIRSEERRVGKECQ